MTSMYINFMLWEVVKETIMYIIFIINAGLNLLKIDDNRIDKLGQNTYYLSKLRLTISIK